jgi:hypothetical protein
VDGGLRPEDLSVSDFLLITRAAQLDPHPEPEDTFGPGEAHHLRATRQLERT